MVCGKNFEAMTAQQIAEVEAVVNAHIRANTAITTDICTMDEAKEKGAMALFGEKYGDSVRVLTMGADAFSMELCGGTHAKRTGDIGLFKIISESGTAAGVRRIEAVTGSEALTVIQSSAHLISNVAGQLKVAPEQLAEKLSGLMQLNKDLTKEVGILKAKLASLAAADWIAEAVDVNGIKVLAKRVEGLDANAQLDAVDQLKNKLGAAVVLLVNIDGDKASVIAGVTKAESKQYKAGDLIRDFAQQTGGKGGGRPDMARGACPVTKELDIALARVVDWVAER